MNFGFQNVQQYTKTGPDFRPNSNNSCKQLTLTYATLLLTLVTCIHQHQGNTGHLQKCKYNICKT